MKVGEFFDKLAGAEVKAPAAPTATDAQSHQRQKVIKLPSLSITGVAFFVAVVGSSFFLGALYGKGQQANSTQTLGTNGSSNSQSGQSQSGGSGFGGGGRFYRSSMSTATVTAISSTNITTQDTSGGTNTYAITSNTVITDGSTGQLDTTSNISTGDTVIVLPDRTATTTARRIIVNPQVPSSQGTQPTTTDPGTAQLE